MADRRTSPLPQPSRSQPRGKRFSIAGVATLAGLLLVMFVLDRLGVVEMNWGSDQPPPTSTAQNDPTSQSPAEIDRSQPVDQPRAEPRDDSAAASRPSSSGSSSSTKRSQKTTLDPGMTRLVPDITIRNKSGRIVFQGEVDLTATLERIDRDETLDEFRNDGITFENREQRLPRQTRGYYREFVHPTPNMGGPGPQRVVAGRRGERYYTADHYETFQRLDQPD